MRARQLPRRVRQRPRLLRHPVGQGRTLVATRALAADHAERRLDERLGGDVGRCQGPEQGRWAADAVKRCAVDASSAVGVSVLALLAASPLGLMNSLRRLGSVQPASSNRALRPFAILPWFRESTSCSFSDDDAA